MKTYIVALVAMGWLGGVQAAQLISSEGAWSSSAVNPASNGGAQTNWNTGGVFGQWGGSFL
ncbi:hypothetical protein PDESU_00016 [Pontiella desulfatans]|uniref:Uncharacterized protein n=1 Tax=Pontiella desulfatans TaxID=2750659 RepID=A0A6C2TVE2_PONDE|nr:hypothetical protein [Pontiella desulfatans]VGO11472.1 hypothetical protein PDESU_00016 [Pontiella desulfatans]